MGYFCSIQLKQSSGHTEITLVCCSDSKFESISLGIAATGLLVHICIVI